MDNLEETDTFWERYNFPRQNQEELENINRLITSTEIKTVIKKLSTNWSPKPDSFTGKFQQTFREKLTPILLKLFQKTTEEGKLPNLLYEATINLIPNPSKDTTKKKITGSITDEHRPKNPQQNISKPNSIIY